MLGIELTKAQREKIKNVIGKCEFDTPYCTGKLHVHRVNRGSSDGKYVLRNIMVICDRHHHEIHFKEF